MFALGTSADVLLVAMLVACLHNSRTGIQRTNSVINLLILYSVNTALFPTVIGVVCLIVFLAMPNSLLYIPFYIQIANLYLVSLVASLNHREVVLEQIKKPLTLDYSAFGRCGHGIPPETADTPTDSQSWLSFPRELPVHIKSSAGWPAIYAPSNTTATSSMPIIPSEKSIFDDQLSSVVELVDIESGDRHEEPLKQ